MPCLWPDLFKFNPIGAGTIIRLSILLKIWFNTISCIIDHTVNYIINRIVGPTSIGVDFVYILIKERAFILSNLDFLLVAPTLEIQSSTNKHETLIVHGLDTFTRSSSKGDVYIYIYHFSYFMFYLSIFFLSLILFHALSLYFVSLYCHQLRSMRDLGSKMKN